MPLILWSWLTGGRYIHVVGYFEDRHRVQEVLEPQWVGINSHPIQCGAYTAEIFSVGEKEGGGI